MPFVTWDREDETFADFKTTTGHFATIDYSEDPPFLYLGRFAEFEELALSNLREFRGGVSERAVRGFNCSACGAAIALRAGQHTTSVACPSCGTIVNPRDPGLQIVQAAEARQEHAPKIPLGTRGTLDGQPWDVIGFQYRTITAEGTDYGWDEYLLFNPYRGFRYLSEYQGHWNVIRPLKVLPGGDRVGHAEYDGQRFTRFQRAIATTRVVFGEFPWQVRAGDKVEAIDFVAPPLMLSSEREGDDETWSRRRLHAGRGDLVGVRAARDAPPPPSASSRTSRRRTSAARASTGGCSACSFLLWMALLTARCVRSADQVVFEQNVLVHEDRPESGASSRRSSTSPARRRQREGQGDEPRR